LPQPKSGDQLLRFGEWAIDDRFLSARKLHPRTLAAGMKTFARQHYAGVRQLLIEISHVGEQLLTRHDTRFGIFIGFNNHHESHLRFSCLNLGLRRVSTRSDSDGSNNCVRKTPLALETL